MKSAEPLANPAAFHRSNGFDQQQVWCYFHEHLHRRHHAFRPTGKARAYLIPGQHVEVTAVEDRESVQPPSLSSSNRLSLSGSA